MLFIDDLGRARMPAPQLLNRLAGPFDTGADKLALRDGHQLGMPFDAMLVLASQRRRIVVAGPGPGVDWISCWRPTCSSWPTSSPPACPTAPSPKRRLWAVAYSRKACIAAS